MANVLLPENPRDLLERQIDQRVWKLLRDGAALSFPKSRWKYKAWIEGTLWAREYKSQFGCLYCSEHDHACLDLHHRDGADKVAAVSALISRGFHIRGVIAEIRKCDVVCANCHRKLHYRKRYGLATLVPRRETPEQEGCRG